MIGVLYSDVLSPLSTLIIRCPGGDRFLGEIEMNQSFPTTIRNDFPGEMADRSCLVFTPIVIQRPVHLKKRLLSLRANKKKESFS
jgi:hypothetical protein